MKWIFTLAIIISPVLITGCNIDSLKSDKSKEPAEIVDISKGSIQVGTTTRYEVVFNTILGDRSVEQVSLDTITYSAVYQLPNEYGYQDPEGGPFLAVTSKNSRTSGSYTSYINPKGSLALSVDSNTYSTQEHSEYVSERDSSSHSYTLGESYKVTDSQKRYSIYTHSEVSNAQGVSVYTPRAVEIIVTESGSYNTLKIDYTNNRSTQFSNGKNEIRKVNGSQWLDIASGILIKDSASGVSERSDYDETIRFNYTRLHIGEIIPIKTIDSVDGNSSAARLNVTHKMLSLI
jgi:hypothetical protein